MMCFKPLLIIFPCLKLVFVPLEEWFIVSGCEKTLGEQIVLWEQKVTTQKNSCWDFNKESSVPTCSINIQDREKKPSILILDKNRKKKRKRKKAEQRCKHLKKLANGSELFITPEEKEKLPCVGGGENGEGASVIPLGIRINQYHLRKCNDKLGSYGTSNLLSRWAVGEPNHPLI